MTTGKIGVFDSGFGGLSILKGIIEVLPQYNYIYLGDTARTPYGSRSQEMIYEYTKESLDFLFKHGAEIVILACNTASSESLRKIQQEYIPQRHKGKKVLGVIIPSCEDAVKQTRNKKIGVLGTEATVASHAFTRELKKLDPAIEVNEVAAPLLVPLVEAGEEESGSAKMFVKKYVDEVTSHGEDTIILGCTHYSYLEDEIQRCAPNVKIVAGGPIVGQRLKDYFVHHREIADGLSLESGVEFYTTDSKENFNLHGSRFFGEKIDSIHAVLSR